MIRFFFSTLFMSFAASAVLEGDDRDPSPGLIPMTSPWDANAWEPGSGSTFWRVKGPKETASSGGAKSIAVSPAATDEHGLKAGEKAPRRFFDRQTEK